MGMGMGRGFWRVFGLLIGLVWVVSGVPEGLPRNFVLERVGAASLDVPTDFVFLPRGQTDRILISEKRGVVKISVGGVIQEEPFLDLSDQIVWSAEKGLLGIAVDIDFENYPYVYCLFTVETDDSSETTYKAGRLSRFRVNDDLLSADPASETILIGSQVPAEPKVGCTMEEQQGDLICVRFNHNVGGVDMDEDGYLYASVGDNSQSSNPGETSGRVQRVDMLIGKVLKVDRWGRAPASNPWYDENPYSNPSRVWALGFRNGFRIWWDRELQALWMGDVGWSQWEEVNLVKAGRNYEWPCRQGTLNQFQFAERFSECYDMLNGTPEMSTVQGIPTSATIAYDHSEGNSITGVAPLKGLTWPEKYRNAIFYTDYVRGWMRYNILDDEGVAVEGPYTFGENFGGPVQLREGPDGCLWYISLTLFGVYKLCYVEDSSLPEVRYVSPANLSRKVERSVNIVVGLNKEVTEESAMASMDVRDTKTGQSVAGTISYDKDALTITFTPDTLLGSWRDIKITVSGLQDEGGREMYGEYVQSYKTGSGYTTYISEADVEEAISSGERLVLFDKARSSGVPIGLGGVPYTRGVSIIPPGEIVVPIPAACKRLQGIVGVDDASQALEDVEVVVSIYRDGKRIFHVPAMTANVDPRWFNLWVRGAGEVVLSASSSTEINSEDTIISWADLKLRCGKFDWKRPALVSVSPEDGSAEVPLNPLAAMSFDEAMDLTSVEQGVSITDLETQLPVSWRLASTNGGLTQVDMDTGSLEYQRSYEVKFSPAVKDLAGNPVAGSVQSFEWSFTTEEEPNEPTTINVVTELTLERTNFRGSISTNGVENGIRVEVGLRSRFVVPHQSCTRLRTTQQLDTETSDPTAKMVIRYENSSGVILCNSSRLDYGDDPKLLDCDITGEESVEIKLLRSGGGTGETFALLTDVYLDCGSTAARRPSCEIAPMADGFAVGDELSFEARALSFAGLPLAPNAIRWDVGLIHCEPLCHLHPWVVVTGSAEGSMTVPDHGDYFYFQFTCIVEDEGLTVRSSAEVRPLTTPVTLTSDPTGVRGAIGSYVGVTPLTTNVVVGTTVPLDVLRDAGYGYTFSSWLHSGDTDPTFLYTLDTTDPVTFTASYEKQT